MVGYPLLEAERAMSCHHHRRYHEDRPARACLTGEELIAAQMLIRRVPVGEKVG